ncbi:MAG: phage portal protein [Candidatus Accumulibacter sp.]|jgi:PBSX family phage portal protein|nr:phage portal protein [Accumulibacter sp.]
MSEHPELFTFGDPEPVLSPRGLLDYLECARLSKWYEPPLSLDGLARAANASVFHASAMFVKRNILSHAFIPSKYLSRADFNRFCWEFLVFGNAYLEKKENRLGGLLSLVPPLAKYVRRALDLDEYFFVPMFRVEHKFKKGTIFHLIEPDLHQEVYGLPQYLAALNSAFLNEAATLFRRRYFKNGSHAGCIFYMTDAAHNQEDIDDFRTALKESKGPGNFRNVFMYAPNGKKDGLQVIPVSEVAAKDDFLNIKNTTRDDQLAAHRVPPQLMGIVPTNTGGFGDVEKAAAVFLANEILPLEARFTEVNEWLGEEVVRFGPHALLPEGDGEKSGKKSED